MGAKADEIPLTEAMLEAGLAVMDWRESDAAEDEYDKYEGPLTSTEVFLQKLYRAMEAASHRLE